MVISMKENRLMLKLAKMTLALPTALTLLCLWSHAGTEVSFVIIILLYCVVLNLVYLFRDCRES